MQRGSILSFSSSFLWIVCQVGAEKALKEELKNAYPDFRFAYSRPGFLTFKSEKELNPDCQLNSVFARAYGVSAGAADIAKVIEFAESFGKPVRLHIWQKDQCPPGEEPLGYDLKTLPEQLEKKLREMKPELFLAGSQAQPKDLVIDVILLENQEIWLGAHLHSQWHSPWPGGVTPLVLPDESPSRAFLKLEEALIWSGAAVQKGDTAVEIGSAPGGASYALLKRGLRVVGIDPAEMDPRILKHPQFRHFQTPVNRVLREDLPDSIQWLLLDMNVEPRISIFAVDRLASRMKESLLGVFLTLKLNDWKIAREIPSILDHVKAMGMVRVRAAQLSHQRQELLVYGLTRKGLARK